MIKTRIIGTKEEVANMINCLRKSQNFKDKFKIIDFSNPIKSRKRDDEYLLYLSIIEN